MRGLLAALVLSSAAVVVGVAHAGYAAIVVNAKTGEVITQVNPDDVNHPASLAKMMTLYLTFQQLQSGKLKLDQQLQISTWASAKSPTKLGLQAGDSITVLDCILGMVTKSANDAATVAAEGIGGSEAHFADLMNQQAARLGMSHTHFANATGLPDPSDATTARDMVTLAMALYRDFPQYTPYFATKDFVFEGHVVHGHNNLMNRYPGMDGLKTGFTNVSGFNLASTAVRDNERLFSVVMGGRTAAVRDQLMARLLDDGFADKETPSFMVAQAGMGLGVGTRARRLLAALSPISSAQADTVPVAPHCAHCRKRRTAVASKAPSATKATASKTATAKAGTKGKARTPKAASTATAKKAVATCSSRTKRAGKCPAVAKSKVANKSE